MTTKEFIALEKSLLPDLPGFTVSGRVMFVPPVKHTLRGVSFDPSAFDKKSFSTTVFVMPLFIPSKHLTLNFADRVRHKGKGDRWSIDMPELSAQLSTALKQQAVPFLYSLESLQDFISMAQQSLGDVSGRRSFKNPHTLQAIAYALARAGRCQQARDALDELLQQLDLKIPWQQAMAERARTLAADIRDRPSEAQRLLEAWEAETVKNLGLDTFR